MPLKGHVPGGTAGIIERAPVYSQAALDSTLVDFATCGQFLLLPEPLFSLLRTTDNTILPKTEFEFYIRECDSPPLQGQTISKLERLRVPGPSSSGCKVKSSVT